MDLTQFYHQFREETAENLRILSDGLLALEQTSGQRSPEARTHIDSIFRAVHTIKGSSRLLGFNTISKLAHTMENVLGAAREGSLTLNSELIDVLLRSGDTLQTLTVAGVEGQHTTVAIEPLITQLQNSLEQAGPISGTSTADAASDGAPNTEQDSANVDTTAQPKATTPRPVVAETAPSTDNDGSSSGQFTVRRSASRQTVRVRVDRLDRLLNLTGELVVGQQMLASHSRLFQEMMTLLNEQEQDLLDVHAELQQLRLPATAFQTIDAGMNAALRHCNRSKQLLRRETEQFDQQAEQQTMLLEDLEQEVMHVRMQPIATVFGALPRAVRELSRSTNKEVELVVKGENTELDRKMLEALNDPLIHLIRNAIDHGIEPPEERMAQQKPRQGQITISAEAIGNEVRVRIRDDGRGMNPAKLREAGVRKGLINAENAALLSDQEAIEIIFQPGFSTASIITDVSGRGVGMDVVRTNIQELGGQVLVESELGAGTEFTLVLPLTLVTTRVLLLRIGERTFALPALGCQGIVWAHQDSVQMIEGRATIVHEEKTISLVRLADLLHIEGDPSFQKRERSPAVLIGSNQRPLGALVDIVLDEREAVVKPMGTLFEAQHFYSGAIQLGDGQLVLLLNPSALAQSARGIALVQAAVTPIHKKQWNVLIAEDSFTTRELLRSILQSAGYHVTAATDGSDALDKLRVQSYDLMVTDVEMPRVDGFELTSRVRQELRLDELPVIIMTSLASDEHRRRGLEVGAQAYIVKSQFNQDNLLEVIQQLLGHEDIETPSPVEP
ncbi:MAG: hybrid sensor histidine kinase/response regulator [Chloroflexaceae bacterium]|nr:hybrid sensor histidine kinase/response regulator [Chloroflexaceae bacterium]